MDITHNHGEDVHVVRANQDDAIDLIAIGGTHSVQVILTVSQHARCSPPLASGYTCTRSELVQVDTDVLPSRCQLLHWLQNHSPRVVLTLHVSFHDRRMVHRVRLIPILSLYLIEHFLIDSQQRAQILDSTS